MENVNNLRPNNFLLVRENVMYVKLSCYYDMYVKLSDKFEPVIKLELIRCLMKEIISNIWTFLLVLSVDNRHSGYMYFVLSSNIEELRRKTH